MAHNILFSYETQPHNATLLALYFIVALNILEFFGTLLALYSLVASNILEFFKICTLCVCGTLNLVYL